MKEKPTAEPKFKTVSVSMSEAFDQEIESEWNREKASHQFLSKSAFIRDLIREALDARAKKRRAPITRRLEEVSAKHRQ